MAYSNKVIDHYENPRNVGSFSKNEANVGTGIVGAPECGDVMKLQLKISDAGVIEDARFKTFGCGSAIASSSYVTELVKGKTLADAMEIKNTQIVEELSLPPVKIHCSVLAEDAIKAAIASTTFDPRRRAYAVNPNQKEILGTPCFKTVLDIPDKVDLATIVVRSNLVPEIMRQCVQKGVKAAVVISAGFGETDASGIQL